MGHSVSHHPPPPPPEPKKHENLHKEVVPIRETHQNLNKTITITVKSYQESLQNGIKSLELEFQQDCSVRLCFERIEKEFQQQVEDSSKFVVRDGSTFEEIPHCWLVKTFGEVGWERKDLLVFFTDVEQSYKNPPRITHHWNGNLDNTFNHTSISPQEVIKILNMSQSRDTSLSVSSSKSGNGDLTITITPSLPPCPLNDIPVVEIQTEQEDIEDRDCNHDKNINITQMTSGGCSVRVDQKLGNIPILGESKVVCLNKNGEVKFPEGNSFLSSSLTLNENKQLLLKYPIIEDMSKRKVSALMSVKRVIILLGTEVNNSQITVKESRVDLCFFMCEMESCDVKATSELLWQYSNTTNQFFLVWRVTINYRQEKKIAFVDEEKQIISGIERNECAVSISATFKNPRERSEQQTVNIHPKLVQDPKNPATKGPYCCSVIKEEKKNIYTKVKNKLKAVVSGDIAIFKCKEEKDYWLISSFVYVCRVAKIMEQYGFKGWGALKGSNHRIVVECINKRLYGISSMNTPDIREDKNPIMQLGYDVDNVHTAYCFHTIWHEYAHAVIDRLLGGAGNCFFQQSSALIEALADFFPCCYTDSEYFAPQSCARGPYNASFKNNMTFAKLTLLPAVDFFDPHHHGELLCATLMEMYRFIGDKDVVMKMVLDALRCCPYNPGFLQFRSCLIVVAIESYQSDSAKFYIQCIWKAFAYFGMGCQAKCHPYNFTGEDSITEIIEDFTVPEDNYPLNTISQQERDPWTKLDRSLSSTRLRIYANGLEVEHVGEKIETNQSVITTHPLDENYPYYEVEIVSVAKKKMDNTGCGVVAVGIGPRDISMDALPGWQIDSYAFHTDDCKIFCQNNVGEKTSMDVTLNPKVIGIGITMNNDFYVTVDQKLLVSKPIFGLSGFGRLFPIIGLDEARVMCNFGQKPSLFRTISVKNSSPAITHDIEHQTLRHIGGPNETDQMVKCTHHFCDQFNYFEIEIVSLPKKGLVVIGLTTFNIPVNKQPGWTTNSFGLHSDDGKFYNQQFISSHIDNVQVIVNPPVSKGDILGCGVNDNQLYFTRNGTKVHSVIIQGLSGLQLYPSIGLDDAEVIYKF